jgi:hypothetical protein
MAATVFDHPWILIIIAAISLVRWLIQKGKTEADNREAPPDQPISRGGESQSEEERIRRFLEALGQPKGSAPPPKVTPRRRRIDPTVFSPLPPLTTAPPPLPEPPRIFRAVPPPLPPEYSPTPLATVTERDFEVRDVARQTSSEPPPEVRRTAAGPIAARIKLGTPQDLRTAIVLREIFGPPRSLQPLDLTSVS